MIVVVGAGFAGLATAIALTEKDDVTVFEEHPRVGYPPHCTGIVSEYVVEALGRPARETVQASYRSVIIEAPKATLEIKTRDRVYKLDRVRLEELMLEDAVSLGVNARLSTRVNTVTREGIVRAGGDTVEASLVVLAEGWRRTLLSSLGAGHKPLQSYGVNIQGRVPARARLDTITVYFDSRLYGTGFGWALPLDSGEHVVGALSFNPSRAAQAAEKLANSLHLTRSPRARYGGVVVHGPPLKGNPRGRILAVGDAAALNKPVTGGGLYPNTLLAQLLREKTPEEAYENVAAKLRSQYRIARALYSRPDAAERLAEAAAGSGIVEVVSGKIGYDEHESLLRLALSSPLKSASTLARLAAGSPSVVLAMLKGALLG